MSQTISFTCISWGPQAHVLTQTSHPELYVSPVAEGRKCESLSHLKGEIQTRTPHLLCSPRRCIPSAGFSDLHRQHNSPAGFIPVQVAGPSDSKYIRLALCWLDFKGKCTNVTHGLIRRRGSESQAFAFPTISRGCCCAWPRGHNLGPKGLKHIIKYPSTL